MPNRFSTLGFFLAIVAGIALIVTVCAFTDSRDRDRVDSIAAGPYVVQSGVYYLTYEGDARAWTDDLGMAWKYATGSAAAGDALKNGGVVKSVREALR